MQRVPTFPVLSNTFLTSTFAWCSGSMITIGINSSFYLFRWPEFPPNVLPIFGPPPRIPHEFPGPVSWGSSRRTVSPDFPCFWHPWQFRGGQVIHFLGGPSIWIGWMFSSWSDGGCGFLGGGPRRWSVILSMSGWEYTLSTRLTTDDVSGGHLVVGVLARLLYCKVTFILPLPFFLFFAILKIEL